MTSEDIYEVLTSLGYTLQDRGVYWQTNAVFRNGDNKTALQIYKDTGVWRDFVANTPPLKFERLVEESLGKNSPEYRKIFQEKDFNSLTFGRPPPRKKIQMEEIYPEESLKKLLPHYRFYNDRGITDSTLKTLKGGLATRGRMYQRFVFPVYNEFKQIHGFSGRDMSPASKRPKWKHIGRKSKWVYPGYLDKDGKSFLALTEESGKVILVESIGDLLSLHEQGYYNVLVTFGLEISPALIAVLIQINPDQIIISLNNDKNQPHNRGLTASIKNYLKLLSYFDLEKLFICLPTENDFGDMSAKDFHAWDKKLHDLDAPLQALKVLKHSRSLADRNQLSKKLLKNCHTLATLTDE